MRRPRVVDVTRRSTMRPPAETLASGRGYAHNRSVFLQ
jgi:hypothetical protein